MAQEQPGVVIRSTTRLVQVHVSVRDGKGNPVSGLARSDFQVLENGKPQTIAFFSLPETTGPLAPLRLPPNVFSNRRTVEGQEERSLTAILLDVLNSGFLDLARARSDLSRIIRGLENRERVPIYVLGNRLYVLHDGYSGLQTVEQALPGMATREQQGQTTDAMDNLRDVDARQREILEQLFAQAEDQESPVLARTKAERLATALRAISRHFAGTPGRKNLIWISGGLPLQRQGKSWRGVLDRAIAELNDANTAIYPFDITGMYPPATSPAMAASPLALSRGGGLRQPLDTANAAQETLAWVADLTGGRAFRNTNRMSVALHQAAADSAASYLLAYHPTEPQDDKFHEIVVRVARRGVDLRHRKGYLALRDAGVSAGNGEAVIEALQAPLEATGLELFARVNDEGEGRLRVTLQVSPGGMTMVRDGDRSRATIEITVAQRTQSGDLLDPSSKTVELTLTAESLQKLQEKGLIYNTDVQVRPKAASVNVLVQDHRGGAQGSLIIPLSRVGRR